MEAECLLLYTSRGGSEGGREAVSVCVVGAPTALLAAPIKTRPRHLASLYNALSPVPSHCAHFPMIAKCQGRRSRLSRPKMLDSFNFDLRIFLSPIAWGHRDLYTFCSFPFVFTITVRYPLENLPRQKGVHDDGDEWSGEGGRENDPSSMQTNTADSGRNKAATLPFFMFFFLHFAAGCSGPSATSACGPSTRTSS